MTPRNENNFLIEVTPEQLEELRNVYRYVDEDGYVEMHYSPYWRMVKQGILTKKDKA